MRYIISKVFDAKYRSLPLDVQNSIRSIIKFLSDSDKNSILQGYKHYKSLNLGNGIYVLMENMFGIYYSFGADIEGEYILLLDITVTQRENVKDNYPTLKNPNNNINFNPLLNTSINPNMNSSINPRYNSSINPIYNSIINPNYNSLINPNYNSMINPNYNATINPKYNSSINPKYNTSLNPRYNISYGGPYIYSLKLHIESFMIRANDSVLLIFNMNSDFIGISVVAKTNISLIYNIDMNWISFLVSVNKDVSIRYDTKSTWTGFVV